MISVHPCRNKLFKDRNWIWRGERESGERDTKTEIERGKRRMIPTHLEERRQKESMTAQYNEIW